MTTDEIIPTLEALGELVLHQETRISNLENRLDSLNKHNRQLLQEVSEFRLANWWRQKTQEKRSEERAPSIEE